MTCTSLKNQLTGDMDLNSNLNGSKGHFFKNKTFFINAFHLKSNIIKTTYIGMQSFRK